jgi:hypothetical protein
MRDLVDDVRTSIMQRQGQVYIPALREYVQNMA